MHRVIARTQLRRRLVLSKRNVEEAAHVVQVVHLRLECLGLVKVCQTWRRIDDLFRIPLLKIQPWYILSRFGS